MKQIPLTQGMFALVDDEDFEWLNQWKWYAKKDSATYYAVRGSRNKTIRMHRLILGLTDKNIFADHIDHNGLNNQRSNLRKATHTQNLRNKQKTGKGSKYLGVCRINNKGGSTTYRAIISVNNTTIYLGAFRIEEDAARAYNEAAIKYSGEFANLNKV